MDIENTLKGLLSSDSHTVWGSCWDVIKASHKEISQFPLARIPEVRNSIQMIKDQSNKDVYQLALIILTNLEQSVCRCKCYSSTQRLLPEEEEERNFVTIEKKKDIPWEPEFVCRCNECGKKYFVQ